MESEIGNLLAVRFPELNISEDVMSSESYWVNVRVGEKWLVVEKTSSKDIGLSVVKDQSLDLGGHDKVVVEVEEAIAWVSSRIAELGSPADS